MAQKHVKSTDPRKAIIVKALKQASGGSKVTLVTEVEPNIFQGRVLRSADYALGQIGGRTGYESLGWWRTSFDSGETWQVQS